MICERDKTGVQILPNACSPAAVEELVRLSYCQEISLTELAIRAGHLASKGMSFEQVCGFLNRVPGFPDVAQVRRSTFTLPPFVAGVLRLPRYSQDDLEIPVVRQALEVGSIVLTEELCQFPNGHAVTVSGQTDFGETYYYDPYIGGIRWVSTRTFIEQFMYPAEDRQLIVFKDVADTQWKMENGGFFDRSAEFALFELEMQAKSWFS